jgi:DNA-binding response OmpR family regulator
MWVPVAFKNKGTRITQIQRISRINLKIRVYPPNPRKSAFYSFNRKNNYNFYTIAYSPLQPSHLYLSKQILRKAYFVKNSPTTKIITQYATCTTEFLMPQTILVVDDEQRLVSLVKSYLEQEGYRVATAYNGREALDVATAEGPDLIVLDVMMPEMDGYEFMRQHRAQHNAPIILLTARVDDEEKVIGLELGADDYITKPFRPRELVARVRAVLRRAGQNTPRGELLEAADISLDRSTRIVQVSGNPVDLTPSEFDLLAALMSAPGRVYSRLDLLDIIQGVRYDGYQRTIDIHIKNLRAKIEPDSRAPRYIQTVYGVGYRFARE